MWHIVYVGVQFIDWVLTFYRINRGNLLVQANVQQSAGGCGVCVNRWLLRWTTQ